MTRHALRNIRRPIYLGDQEAGIAATSRDQASRLLHKILTRRGYTLSLGDVDATCRVSPGRFTYTIPKKAV